MSVDEVVLSSKPLKQQVIDFYRTQIMLTPRGAGMTNAIFLLPHSVVIEVTPPHFTDFCLSTMIHHARLHYIYIPYFNDFFVSAQNRPLMEQLYLENRYPAIRSKFKMLDIHTDIFLITAGVEDAIAYLDNHYRKEVNDVQSPIFL